MFPAAHRSSSGALDCICSLWFICPYGDRPLSSLSGQCPLRLNNGIINSITKLHLVGISTEIYSIVRRLQYINSIQYYISCLNVSN